MRRFFYLRLALTNLRNNRSSYFPYILSCSTIIGLFYLLHAITVTTLSSEFEGVGTTAYILMLGTVIAGIVSVLIIFYTNSFLMKRRQKELGLYSVLGMEKQHVARVLLCEVALTGGCSMAAGILGGLLLGRLVFLVLLNLVRLPAQLEFAVPPLSVGTTVALFTGNFLLVMGYNFWQLRRANPIALLRGGQQGEREPKAKWVLALLGALTLGAGYGMALWVRTPSDAIGVFFFAVLLVIAGTYLLFTAGSIALLKLMKRSKRFYYHPRRFIAVSGMMYRMKQNAVGLANICILSTCILVTLSSTVSLYIGEEELLRGRFPYDVHTSCTADTEDVGETVERTVQEHTAKYGVTVEDAVGYHQLAFASYSTNENAVTLRNVSEGILMAGKIIPLSAYNRNTGESRTLNPGEALVAASLTDFARGEALTMDGVSVRLRERIAFPEFLGRISITEGFLLVVPDGELSAIRDALNQERDIDYQYDFNLTGSDESKAQFSATLRQALKLEIENVGLVENIFTSRQDFYTLYGSLMFLGIFFVILFAITAVLIIYYKQVSEGYDDHDRFVIMQKVGMSRREVRGTINQQVLLVFFLPLSMAVLHVAVAFPVLCKLLTVFYMTNTMLFLGCTAAAVLVFAMLYLLVYRATAKTYYSLVQCAQLE